MATTTVTQILRDLKTMGSECDREGMKRFSINVERALGVSMTTLRGYARDHARTHGLRRNHPLALELWETGIHEARLLASIVDDPARVSEAQMDEWSNAFDSWDVCDQCCGNLFDKTPFAWAKAHEWAAHEQEFVRRAGFALIAQLAVHDKKADDENFREFFPLIERYADDPRNFVKKAVNWALRQIGKRQMGRRDVALATGRKNEDLFHEAFVLAQRLASSTNSTTRWIGRDAVRELSKYA
jgi:3-methyladenine DNA glycosylase AlkD